MAPTVELAEIGADVGAGEAIRMWRINEGITQWEMAQMLGITQPQMSKIETNESHLSVAQRWCLVETFGISSEELGLTRALPRRSKMRPGPRKTARRHMVAV